MKNKLFARIGMGVVASQLALIILSWLLSAMRQEGVRSLLSSEGIRWFIGGFNNIVATPLLVCLLLLLVAVGTIEKSGVPVLFAKNHPLTYRDRIALRVSFAFLIIYIVIICLLTLTPHAILLSATGQLFPSAFSRSFVPLLAFGICLFSVSFGVMSGRLKALADVFESLTFGLSKGAPLIVLYILIVQLLASVGFVFMS